MAEDDAFDRSWAWANKPLDSPLTIPAEIHDAVMMLTEDERKDRHRQRDRADGTLPSRPTGSADQYGVPVAAKESDATASQ
jgi:hypothetical protein